VTPDVAVNAIRYSGLVCTLAGGECDHARGNCPQLIGRGTYNTPGMQSMLQQRNVNVSKRSGSVLQLHPCGDLQVVSRLPAAWTSLPGNWIIGF